MTTIHVVYGYKQYSDSAIIVAAFDTAEAANDFRLLVDALEPRYALRVQECELQSRCPDGSITRISVPTKQWAGGPVKGTPFGGDPTEARIPPNPNGPTIA